ncbi:hypothetical protein [Hydrogenophaga sp.]|uniref:hypothetical protein n=1 Tax=Hydrogenophaga sp. TaxID=1904254 RepID=UPI0025C03879|nr:hypothetical protein [Hydrogenophaga sp.]
MKSKSLNTPWQRSSVWARGLALVSLAAGAWALSAGAAQARGDTDVYWSIGINQPGVSVGVSNAPPVVYREPRVVYREPVVVYREPRVVYREPRVVYQRPVVVAPAPVIYQSWGHPRFDDRRGYKKHKWHKRQERYESRYDNRWDGGDRRGGRGRD